MASDPIDLAARAVEQKAAQRFVAQVQLGRPDRVAMLDVPADITADELLGLMGAVSQTRQRIAAQSGRGRLLIPTVD